MEGSTRVACCKGSRTALASFARLMAKSTKGTFALGCRKDVAFCEAEEAHPSKANSVPASDMEQGSCTLQMVEFTMELL